MKTLILIFISITLLASCKEEINELRAAQRAEWAAHQQRRIDNHIRYRRLIEAEIISSEVCNIDRVRTSLGEPVMGYFFCLGERILNSDMENNAPLGWVVINTGILNGHKSDAKLISYRSENDVNSIRQKYGVNDQVLKNELVDVVNELSESTVHLIKVSEKTGKLIERSEK